jgi:general secretion pathway protein B
MVVVSAPPLPRPGPEAVALPADGAAPPPPASASSPVRAVLLAQLAADLRRELPPLTLGGAIWSDSAASRFVIVNGQVLREGEVAAPGVVLERIGQKAVFLRWRDWRIEVPI